MQPRLDQNATAMQARLAGATATGRSADGLVTIVVGGLGDVRAVRVEPRALDLEDVTALEAAFAEALRSAFEAGRRLVLDTMMAAALERASAT
ncbi:YbaB/EbfC family nucleoid-associated protein [Micromonospora profundi]|uniref:YbaB/EbfC family nucleoid-associated protein n=1 Tax=Micromonospora profundi TaxID=1420889 RepID=UPI00364B5BC9